MKDLAFVHKKVESNLDNGFSSLDSSGARFILINSCLDNIPTFTMSFYLLNEGIHYKVNMDRAIFFWEGVGGRRKCPMVK
jgi:hypothetical protein